LLEIRHFDLKYGNNAATVGAMRTSKVRAYRDKDRAHLKFVVSFKRNGKRARSFFETKKAAQTFAQIKNNERLIGETEGAKQLAEFGKTIADAIAFYLHYLQAQSKNRKCTFAELGTELRTAKAKDGASAAYLTGLKCRLGQFENSFGKRLVSEIRTDEIDDWLRGLDVSAVSRNNSRRILRTAFSFALACNYCFENPVTKTAKAKERAGIPGILTVTQAARLLENATPDVLPYLAIGLFAGLRRAEIERLDWSEIDFESGLIEVTAQNSKTAQRRLVTMQPNLREWLLPLRKHKGNVTPSNCFRESFEQAREAAGIAEWPDNALRHSFASYHLAAFKNAASTALELGHHDSRITFAHYRELVKPKDAERYWNLFPAAGASSKVVSIPSA
jgi:integrase